MLFNYLKLSLRLMARNPFFTSINIAGLSIAFSVFIILWQYARNELKSDQQWADWQRMARLGMRWEFTDDSKSWEVQNYGATGFPFAMQLTQDFPELEAFTRILPRNNFNEAVSGLGNRITVTYEQPDQTAIRMLEEQIVMADENVLRFFNIQLLKGDQNKALGNGSSVVIAESIAQKYFGTSEALGKTLLFNNLPYLVTGVFSDLPVHTHLNFQFVLSNQSMLNVWSTAFGPPSVISYVKSSNKIDWSAFEAKINIPELIEKYYGPALRIFYASKAKTLIQPINEMAFSERWRGDQFEPKSASLLKIFQLVAVMVLVLAFVNYLSLNTARLKSRLKEIATRKASGASSVHFIGQFAVESGVMIAMSLAIAITLLQLIKNPLYILLRIPMPEADILTVIIVALVALIMIVLAALYPAYLSGLYKIRELFNKAKFERETSYSRWSVTAVQISIAVILIIWVFIIYNQIQFLLDKDLGFAKENLLTINAPVIKSPQHESDWDVFKNKLGTLTGISQVAGSTSVMGDEVSGFIVRRPGTENLVGFDTNGGVDENFLPMFNIKLIAGRNFSPNENEESVLLSEGALPRLGFVTVEEAINAPIEVYQDLGPPARLKPARIIGVFKGYRVRPMLKHAGAHDMKADAGIILTYGHRLMPHLLLPERITLRVESDKLDEVMGSAQAAYEKIFPGNVFVWYFLDDHVNRHYRSEKVWRNQILFFTLLAIGITCLGVLGMITHKATEKTKEIGVRKVLGAGLHQIAEVLLYTTFKQILIAILIGIPVAFYFTRQYLEKFSDRIDLQWWHFALPVVILILIMLGTVATVVWRAAKSNPVEALKYE